jgi:hypothetical protein
VSSPFELGLRLLLLAWILDPPIPWVERIPVLVLAGAGLLVPGLLRSRGLWLGLLIASAAPLVWHWPFPDNHDYLGAIACLAVLCALVSAEPEKTLASSARWLVGLTFAFAMLWKAVLAPDFVDGRFFRVTLLTDGRFEDLAVLVGGTTWDAWETNDLALGDVLRGEAPESGAGFREPPGTRRLATLLTAATLASEGLVALSFLWPPGRGPSRARDLALLSFGVGTYAFATVRGFGWLLMALGVAQSAPGRRGTRLAYLAVFALIGVYRAVPWSSWLIERLG